MVDGFLPGMGAADKVEIPNWKVRSGTIKAPNVETRIDPVTGRPMDTSKPMTKRTGQAMNTMVEAANPTADAEVQGKKELDAGLDMSGKHGIHGATEPSPRGIWKTQAAAKKVERPSTATYGVAAATAKPFTQSAVSLAVPKPAANPEPSPKPSPSAATLMRPGSAPVKPFQWPFDHRVGPEALPAGLAGFLGNSGNWTQKRGPNPDRKQILTHRHATATSSPYAEISEPGWAPAEPATKPSWADVGAGSVSKGSIDNSYMPVPLSNRWGKSRELQSNEVRTLPHKQATDLLHVALGGTIPLPPQSVEDMPAVGQAYARPFNTAHPVDPIRYEEGWVRFPNTFPGAKDKKAPVYKTPLERAAQLREMYQIPNSWREEKHRREEGMERLKTVPLRPRTAAHEYNERVGDQRKGIKRQVPEHFKYTVVKAGLAGGLSLVDAS